MVALATGSTSLAGQLDAQQRQDLDVVVLVGGCVTDLARQNEVSRKFIYQQKEQAQQALQESFTGATGRPLRYERPFHGAERL